MKFFIEERFSESPFVERVWRNRSEEGGDFTSIATSHCGLVVWEQYGKTYLTLRGPESHASVAPVPADTEFFGIIFKLGCFLAHLPNTKLVDNDLTFPDAANQSFWLDGTAWEIPNYDNADTFVDWLVRKELLVVEPLVEASLKGQNQEMSLRTRQRRFLQSTGLTLGAVAQIERARHATILLQSGYSILDTVAAAGYYDQAHLTRSFKRFIGQSPAKILQKQAAQLSFLYKTQDLEYFRL